MPITGIGLLPQEDHAEELRKQEPEPPEASGAGVAANARMEAEAITPASVADDSVVLTSARSLARMFSVSTRTVWRLRSAGKLPRPLSVGGSVRWRLTDIRLWESMGCPDQRTFEESKAALHVVTDPHVVDLRTEPGGT